MGCRPWMQGTLRTAGTNGRKAAEGLQPSHALGWLQTCLGQDLGARAACLSEEGPCVMSPWPKGSAWSISPGSMSRRPPALTPEPAMWPSVGTALFSGPVVSLHGNVY